MITAISTSGIGMMDIGSKNHNKSKDQDKNAVEAFSSLMNATNTMQDVINKETHYSSNEDNHFNTSDFRTLNTKTYDNDLTDNDSIDDTEFDDYNKVEKDNNFNNETKEVNEYNKNHSSNNAEKVSTDTNDGLSENGLEEDELIMVKSTNIFNMLCEELGLTSEEGLDILNQLDIDMEQLLDPQNIKSFALVSLKSSEVNILTDENVATAISNLLKEYEEIMKHDEVNISNNDEVDMSIENELKTTTDNDGSESITTSDKSSNAISTDSVSNSDSDKGQFGQNQSNQSDASSIVINNINQAFNNVINNEVEFEGLSKSTQNVDIVKQIIDQIKVNVTKDSSSIEINLNPESLGKVNVSVVSKNGVMSAQILAETEAAKLAIEGSLNSLKEAFNNQEIKVEAIEVMVGTYDLSNQQKDSDNENQNQNNKQSKSLTLNGISGEVIDNMSNEDIIQIEMMKMEGRSVSYMA